MVSRKTYWSSFSWSGLWKSLLLFGGLFLLYFVLKDLILAWWVNPIASKFPKGNVVTDLLFAVLFVFSIRSARLIRRRNLIPTPDGLSLFLSLGIFYMIVRVDDRFDFYYFNLPLLHWLSYSDAIFFALIPIWIPCAAFSEGIVVSNQNESLLPDDPDPADAPDLAGNGSFAEAIGVRINSTTTQSSFTIGIFGPWGSGKTHFLLSLKNYLQQKVPENKINQVFFFNPWKSGNVESIVDDFFIILSKALKPFNRSIAQDIKRYSKKLFGPGKDFGSRVADTILDEFIPEFTLEEKFETIRKGILATGKRFVFLIDDVDRMTGLEIMQVIKLVRTTANFGNVFFVLTLDFRYTVEALKRTRAFSREDEYLKKIFQLTITLPPVMTDTLSRELLRLFIPDDKQSSTSEEEVAYQEYLKGVINELRHHDIQFLYYGTPQRTSYLESMLNNYRDLKRFKNAFSITAKLTYGELNFSDLFLLELIKAKSIYTYENVASGLLLKHVGDFGRLELDSDAWDNFARRGLVQRESFEPLKKAINRLFSFDDKKGSRQISRRENFFLYFNYQLFGLISLHDFTSTIEGDWKYMNEKFMEWWKSKRKDLEDILDKFQEYTDLDQFRKLLKVFIQNGHERNFGIRAKAMLFNVSPANFQACFKDDKTYSAFVKEIINDAELPLLQRAIIAKELLVPTVEYSSKPSFDDGEITALIERFFALFLEEAHGFDDKIHQFLMLNGERSNSDHYTIRPKAAKMLKEYLSADPSNLDAFLNTLIRSYAQPNDGRFTFEPFTEQIFGTWDEFEHELLAHTPISAGVQCIIPFIKEYKGYKREGKDFFDAKPQDKEPILVHLRETGQYDFPPRGTTSNLGKPTLTDIF